MNKTRLWAALAAPACLLAMTACDASLKGSTVKGVCDYAPASKPPSAKLSKEQRSHAETIVLKAAEMKIPRRAAEVAMTAALQESSLRNDAVGDNGSAFGLFQMRPVINGKRTHWGSYGEVTNPDYAAGKFYRVLKKVDGWELMSHAQAAQKLDRSADGSLYQDNVRHAKKIVARIAWQKCRAAKSA